MTVITMLGQGVPTPMRLPSDRGSGSEKWEWGLPKKLCVKNVVKTVVSDYIELLIMLLLQ